MATLAKTSLDSEAVDGVGRSFADPNPQSVVCHKILDYMPFLHQVRELAHNSELKQDELGFYDVEEIEALMGEDLMRNMDDLSEMLLVPEPKVFKFPRAPNLEHLIDGVAGNNVINFGAGSDESEMPGLKNYDPYHFHGEDREFITREEYAEALSSPATSIVSRNSIMHLEELPKNPGAHIIPDYAKWVKAGAVTEVAESKYAVTDLIAANGVGDEIEHDHSSSADIVVSMGMYLILYVFPTIKMHLTKVTTRFPYKGSAASLSEPGSSVTLPKEAEYNPKLDGELRFIQCSEGTLGIYDRNGEQVAGHVHNNFAARFKLICELVGDVYYVLGGSYHGIRIPQLRRVIHSFCKKLDITGINIRPRPSFAEVGDIPIDGVIGSNWADRSARYYKGTACVDVDLLGKDLKDPEGPLAQAARKSAVDINVRKVNKSHLDDKKMYTVRLAQLCTFTDEHVVATNCFQVTAVTTRSDKKRSDLTQKISTLLLQPKAEQIVKHSELSNTNMPKRVELDLQDIDDVSNVLEKIL